MRALKIFTAAFLAIVPPMAPAVARPLVLELFTSQGCSSCPPADALLGELAARSDLLPLAFHVTYWNALGWRDPFSTETATARQAAYAAQLGGGSYTPELVVDGKIALIGSDRAAVASALAAASRGVDVPITAKTRDGSALTVTLGAAEGKGRVLLVGFDRRRVTHVGRGENGGRTLVDTNIVRSVQTIGSFDGRPQSYQAVRSAGTDAAILVQAPDLHFIGAARL